MTYSDAVRKCCELEESLQLYDIKIWGVPIWRALRDKYRKRFVLKHTGITPLNNHPKFNIIVLIKSYIISLCHFIYLILCGRKVNNLLFGFPRLEKIDGHYVDKFVDPLILLTKLKNDYLYLERGRSGIHQRPRAIKNIIYTEFIDNTSSVLSIILFPITCVLFIGRLLKIYVRAKQFFSLSPKDMIIMNIVLGRLLWRSLLIYLLFKRLKVKKFFAPALCLFYHYILVCKKIGIRCYEIQHGITTGLTTVYSGRYIPICYPDYFLAFGEDSISNIFGIPVQQVLNVGFAFKHYIEGNQVVNRLKDTYLVLSDPEITDKIVDITIELSKEYPQIIFNLRLHPQERLSSVQKAKLCKNSIVVTNNSVNSFYCIANYEGVLGVNTSVLYEALSIGVKAACISYDNLSPDNYPNPIIREFFFILNSKYDFKAFASSVSNPLLRNYFYGDFNKEKFESLL